MTAVVNGYYHSASRAAQYATDFRWHMICYWIPGEFWVPGKICYWSPGKFLPAVSCCAIRLGPHPLRARPGWKFPPMTKANGDGAMRDGALGASAASIRRSQTRADAKREAKDREREKRQSRQQNEQSMREYRYAQYRDDAAKDLQVHTLSYRHYATSA